MLLSTTRQTASLRRIVIGLDFSTGSLAAARWVAEHLAPRAELVLTHVIPLPPVPEYLHGLVPASAGFVTQVTTAMHGGLSALADALGAVRCAVEVRVGDPAEQLVAVAAEHEADLIAIGRVGQRARGGKQLGSTAERLLRRTTMPVLLAGGPLAGPPRRLLAAVDEGDGALDVLGWARRLAASEIAPARAGSLTVLHVLSDALPAYLAAIADEVAATAAVDAMPAIAAESIAPREAASTWLHARLSASGIDPASTTAAVAIGDARHELLAAADAFESDLVIVGRQGAGSRAAAGLGSVARAAVRPTTRSVLVVPFDGARALTLVGDGRRRFPGLRSPAARLRMRSAGDPDFDPPAA